MPMGRRHGWRGADSGLRCRAPSDRTLGVAVAGGWTSAGMAIGAVFGASVELGRSAWRVSQRQVFVRGVAEERRDEWRAGARSVVVNAVIGFVAFVAASWVLVR